MLLLFCGPFFGNRSLPKAPQALSNLRLQSLDGRLGKRGSCTWGHGWVAPGSVIQQAEPPMYRMPPLARMHLLLGREIIT